MSKKTKTMDSKHVNSLKFIKKHVCVHSYFCVLGKKMRKQSNNPFFEVCLLHPLSCK